VLNRHLLRIALLFAPAVLTCAQAGHITPFTGTWKLNVEKSRFHPGPPFRSFVITFEPDGTRTLDLIAANGQPLQASLPWSDGKGVSVKVTQGSMENVTAVSMMHGRTFDDIWRENGKVIEKVHGAVSSDGRTLTTTVHGTDRQGRAFHNQLKFEKH